MTKNRYVEDLVRQWELADPRDRWRHTGEAPPPANVRNGRLGTKAADNEKTSVETK
jgi:hypothetical protein